VTGYMTKNEAAEVEQIIESQATGPSRRRGEEVSPIEAVVSLADQVEAALRVLVETLGQTSLAKELEGVRQFRGRLELRAAQEIALSNARGEELPALEYVIHDGRGARVLRRFVERRSVSSPLAHGFVLSGTKDVEVAEIIYTTDWRVATVPVASLREIK
jgi:hypothetical protein